MAEHSPTPWCVEPVQYTGSCIDYPILDANGTTVAQFISEADAALIVKAVNDRDRLRDIIAENSHLREALKSICDYAGCCCVARCFDHDHMVELVMRGHAALKAKEDNK